MANYSAAVAKHVTVAMVAATVDTVTLTSDHDFVEVLNRSTTDAIFFTTDGSVPTSNGDDTFIVLAGQSLKVKAPLRSDAVKLVSAGTPTYSVTGMEA